MDDAAFRQAVEQGTEPSGHLANLRLAWLMAKEHGDALGLQETEAAIRRRAERSGGTWNPQLTLSWYQRVTALRAANSDTFEGFVAAHPGLLHR